MEQTDYIVKEIEKVGVVLRAIRNFFLHDTDNETKGKIKFVK